jgi:hypothetical protein
MRRTRMTIKAINLSKKLSVPPFGVVDDDIMSVYFGVK